MIMLIVLSNKIIEQGYCIFETLYVIPYLYIADDKVLNKKKTYSLNILLLILKYIPYNFQHIFIKVHINVNRYLSIQTDHLKYLDIKQRR